MKTYSGSEGIDPRILDLDTRWKWCGGNSSMGQKQWDPPD